MRVQSLLTNIIIFLVLLCQVFVVTLYTESNPHTRFVCGPRQLCKCNRKSLLMKCDKYPLKTFVMDTMQNLSWVENLIFQKSLFQTVPDLSMFTNLKRLVLVYSQISKLEENSFAGLENLEHLDVRRMNLSFNTGTIHNQTFKKLTKLQELSIKQSAPLSGSGKEDYSFLLPLRNTLRKLFIVGTPNLPQIFNENFTNLRYLSLALKEMTQDRLILISSAWDFLAGGSISNNLSVIIAETKKFILVITPDYFNDEGTSKEFNLMQSAGLLQREKVLLMFTSASVAGNHLPGVLREMFNGGEFLIWPSGLCSGIEFKEMARKIIEKVQE